MPNEDNHIVNWFKSDEKLCEIVNAIEALKKSSEESARMAFYKVADYFKLPKQPEDITEQMYREFDEYGFEPESVFEQMAVINYMSDTSDDKRSLVMQALYNVYHKEYHGLEYAAKIYFGGAEKIPQTYACYLFGNDIDARITFSIKEDNWVNAGARMKKKATNN